MKRFTLILFLLSLALTAYQVFETSRRVLDVQTILNTSPVCILQEDQGHKQLKQKEKTKETDV